MVLRRPKHFNSLFIISMFQKLKQYKDLRDSAKKAQSVLSAETVHTEACGGNIAMVMDGNQKIIGLDINASLLAPENKKKIEDGIKECLEKATKKLQMMMLKKMKSGELQMPDISKVS